MKTATLEQVKTQIKAEQQRHAAELKITYVETLVSYDIANLKKPAYNHRVIVESRLQVLIRSLKEHGFLGGIFINPHTSEVIDGWHRCEQWAALGNTTVPCYRISCTRQQERKLHLSLNQQATTFNTQELGLDFDINELLDYGFTENDLNLLPEPAPEPKVERVKASIEGMSKLMTLVKAGTLERLKAIQKANKLPSLGDVVDFLAQNA